MVEWIEGFSHIFAADSTLARMSQKYETFGGVQGQLVAGRYNGYAVRLSNTGFGSIRYRRDYMAFSAIAFGADVSFQTASGFFGNSYFFRVDGNDGSCLCGFGVRGDGRVQFLRGGNGLDPATATEATDLFVATPDKWYNLQCHLTFPQGLLIQYEKENGSLETVNMPLQETTNGETQGRYITIVWSNLGVQAVTLCNYWINSPIGLDRNTLFAGSKPRVYTFFATSDYLLEWQPDTGLSGYQRLNETNPMADEDLSYCQSNISGKKLLPGFSPVQPIGTIQGVALTAQARGVSAGSYRAFVKQASNNYKSAQVLTSAYAFYQHLWQDDPQTGLLWKVGGVQMAKFGVEAVSGTSRVSQLVLEILVAGSAIPNRYHAF